MNTSTPISTISYNTLDFFLYVLGQLLLDHIISFYAFIQHFGEPDGVGDEHKDHIHAYFEPARRFQTEEIRELFKEPDPDNDKPLCCQPFRKSKWADWFLYGVHDPAYLASKGMSRTHTYGVEQVITSDVDYMKMLINEIDTRTLSPYMVMINDIRKGYGFTEYMVRENIDVRYTHQYERAYTHLEDMYRHTSLNSEDTINVNDEISSGAE